jgi:hypothetical protein
VGETRRFLANLDPPRASGLRRSQAGQMGIILASHPALFHRLVFERGLLTFA